MDIAEMIGAEDVSFLSNFMFGISLTPSQEEIVRDISFSKSKRVVISSYTRHGKTLSTAIGIMLYIFINPGRKIRWIAPLASQSAICRNYFAELAIKSPMFLDLMDINVDSKEDRLKKEVSKTRMTFKNGCELMFLSAEGDANRLLGWGGDKIIIDESCLIDYEIYRAKISRMLGDSPDSELVELGNPWNKYNQFWEHWNDPGFTHIHISYKTGLKENRISTEFVEEQRKLLTPLEFKILYEAEFPDEATDALFSQKAIEYATTKGKLKEGKIYIGIDVARFGADLTVATVIKLKDNEISVEAIHSWGKADLMATADRISNLSDELSPELILVDDTGLGGGCTDRLNQLGYSVYPINFGEKSPHKRYANMKTEIFMNLSVILTEKRISIPNHKELKNQMLKMRYEISSGAKISIVDNQDKSPDYADSLAIACYSAMLDSSEAGAPEKGF